MRLSQLDLLESCVNNFKDMFFYKLLQMIANTISYHIGYLYSKSEFLNNFFEMTMAKRIILQIMITINLATLILNTAAIVIAIHHNWDTFNDKQVTYILAYLSSLSQPTFSNDIMNTLNHKAYRMQYIMLQIH